MGHQLELCVQNELLSGSGWRAPSLHKDPRGKRKSTETEASHHSSSKPCYIIPPQGPTLFLLKELVNHPFFLKTVPLQIQESP